MTVVPVTASHAKKVVDHNGQAIVYFLVQCTLPGESQPVTLKVTPMRKAAQEWTRQVSENALADMQGDPAPYPNVAAKQPSLMRISTSGAKDAFFMGNIYARENAEIGYITKYGVKKGEYGIMADTSNKQDASWNVEWKRNETGGEFHITEREMEVTLEDLHDFLS